MTTPYITPSVLTSAGQFRVAWNTIPTIGATSEAQQQEQLNICQRASADVNGIVNQVLAATFNLETFIGPDFDLAVYGTSALRAMTTNTPIIGVYGGQWQFIGATNWIAINPNQTINPSPPYNGMDFSNAGYGENGVIITGLPTDALNKTFMVQLALVSGYPHTQSTEALVAGATTITVADVTGWNGLTGEIRDGVNSEPITVSSVTASANAYGVLTGAGTLNLASPLINAHITNTLVSTLPRNIEKATLYLAVAEALSGGTTAIAVPPAKGSTTGGGSNLLTMYRKEARELLKPFMRVL